jgi:hypothetical protein
MGQQRQFRAEYRSAQDVLRAAEGIHLATSLQQAASSPSSQESLLEVVSYSQEV